MSFNDRIESIKNLVSVLNNNSQPYFTKDYLIKILNLEKQEIRKSKIKKLFNE